VTVDLAIFTVLDRLLHLLVVERGEPPFAGALALPGGFVRPNEDLDEAARRELLEETGLAAMTERGGPHLAQVGAFGRPDRDPRMRVISVASFALVPPELVPQIRAGGDAAHARWVLVRDLRELSESPLAFDHPEIIDAALTRLRSDLDQTSIAFALVPDPFTIQELRTVHEAIGGAPIDPGNFRKRVLRMIDDGMLELARGKRQTASKPANLYRFVAPR